MSDLNGSETIVRAATERGELVILRERCKGCNFCIEFCPLHVLQASGRFNSQGYVPPVLKPEGHCSTCAFCQWICPDFAIYVVKDEKDKKPVQSQSGSE